MGQRKKAQPIQENIDPDWILEESYRIEREEFAEKIDKAWRERESIKLWDKVPTLEDVIANETWEITWTGYGQYAGEPKNFPEGAPHDIRAMILKADIGGGHYSYDYPFHMLKSEIYPDKVFFVSREYNEVMTKSEADKARRFSQRSYYIENIGEFARLRAYQQFPPAIELIEKTRFDLKSGEAREVQYSDYSRACSLDDYKKPDFFLRSIVYANAAIVEKEISLDRYDVFGHNGVIVMSREEYEKYVTEIQRPKDARTFELQEYKHFGFSSTWSRELKSSSEYTRAFWLRHSWR
jgi:hypothetical protein